jgi:hypothetical protein
VDKFDCFTNHALDFSIFQDLAGFAH